MPPIEKSTFGRTIARILVGVLFAIVLFVLYLRLFAGEVIQRTESPDGRFVAEVRELHNGSAVDADNIGVELRTKWNPFRHEIYGGLDYGVGISISWVDSANLLVTCTKCEKLGQSFKESKWHDVVIQYVGQ